MLEKSILHKNLIVSIIALANEKQNQIDYTFPGCAICDIIEDFETYGNRCYSDVEYTIPQNECIKDLKTLLDAFCKLGTECFNSDILDHPDWINIRIKAKETLTIFGYQMTELPQSINTGNSVWKVDISKYKLKKII